MSDCSIQVLPSHAFHSDSNFNLSDFAFQELCSLSANRISGDVPQPDWIGLELWKLIETINPGRDGESIERERDSLRPFSQPGL